MKIQNIYVLLRVPTQKINLVVEQIKNLSSTHPLAQVNFAGLGFDGDKNRLILQIKVPLSNTEPSAIEAIRFVHDLNLNMFIYHPSFTAMPTSVEKENLTYLTDDLDLSVLVSESERVYA